jgi:hypothetical protein
MGPFNLCEPREEGRSCETGERHRGGPVRVLSLSTIGVP